MSGFFGESAENSGAIMNLAAKKPDQDLAGSQDQDFALIGATTHAR